MTSRIEKIVTERRKEAAVVCSMPGSVVEVWGWRKLKNKGRRSWWARRVQVLYEDGLFRTKELEDL